MDSSWKYPRTFHVPFSEGLQNDDRRVDDDWFSYLKGKELVLTEKLDGENSSISKYGVYARSHAAPTRNPWSINLWGNDGLYWRVKDYLGEDEMIVGENLYGVHSIEYNRLKEYFHLFAVRNDERWYSWDEIVEMAEILNLPTVPVLERCVFENEEELKERILYWMTQGSRYGDTIEGVVTRTVESYPIDEFSHNVVKYVRKNHVQTDQFWAKNWRKAKINEYY